MLFYFPAWCYLGALCCHFLWLDLHLGEFDVGMLRLGPKSLMIVVPVNFDLCLAPLLQFCQQPCLKWPMQSTRHCCTFRSTSYYRKHSPRSRNRGNWHHFWLLKLADHMSNVKASFSPETMNPVWHVKKNSQLWGKTLACYHQFPRDQECNVCVIGSLGWLQHGIWFAMRKWKFDGCKIVPHSPKDLQFEWLIGSLSRQYFRYKSANEIMGLFLSL